MRRPRALPAALAVLLLVLGQLGALAHLAATRHVTCAEHGEELETARLADALHDCGDSHLVGVTGSAGDHADCEIARALHHGGTRVEAVVVNSTVAVALTADPPRVRTASAAVTLYRIAPKTSPPAHVVRVVRSQRSL